MGSKEEADEIMSTLKLPLLSIQAIDSPEHSGMLTPPLHTSGTVPFRWEEEPGKPRPCTALIAAAAFSHDPNNNSSIKCLELPPRLQLVTEPKMTKIPSPTTVLDSSLFQSSSFRFTRRRRQGSFGSSCSSPERGQIGNSVVVISKSLEGKEGGRSGGGGGGGGLFGSWRRKSQKIHHKRGKSEVGVGSCVFSASLEVAAGFGGVDDDLESGGGATKVKKVWGIKRNGSFSSLSKVKSSNYYLWATIYQGFKQVLPWKNTDRKKDGLPI